MFTEEEFEALVLGSRWVSERADLQLSRAAKGALSKIASVLPHDLRTALDASSLMVGKEEKAEIEAADLPQIRTPRRLCESSRVALGPSEGPQRCTLCPGRSSMTNRRTRVVQRPAPTTLPVLSLEQAGAAAAAYARGSRARSTWRAYEVDWRNFENLCRTKALRAMPAAPETVALYVSAEGKRGSAPSTLGRRLATIRLVHLAARLPPLTMPSRCCAKSAATSVGSQ
jgi:hypothetical protein